MIINQFIHKRSRQKTGTAIFHWLRLTKFYLGKQMLSAIPWKILINPQFIEAHSDI
jgi:hypothetical protein